MRGYRKTGSEDIVGGGDMSKERRSGRKNKIKERDRKRFKMEKRNKKKGNIRRTDRGKKVNAHEGKWR